jgi:hypothetical protein
MFSNTTLYIPDYVVVEYIPTIIKYFVYYDIAKVKKVQVFKHCEPEYYVEDRCPYGFALIEIDYYYSNQGARNFYSSIENNKGIIVYDDPNFWEVQFSPYTEDKSSVLVNHNKKFQNYSTCDSDYDSDEECFYNNDELEEDQEQDQDQKEEQDKDQKEEEPIKFNTDYSLDNFNYANYEKNYASFKKKQSSKKQKLSNELYEIKTAINNICTKQDKLLKLLLINNELKSKKQKNNQKIKEFKTSWARRLRHESI